MTNIDDFHFIPDNPLWAPVPDLVAGFDCIHQQDDKGDKHQYSQDNSYGLHGAQNAVLVGWNYIH